MITFFFKNLLPHIGRFEQKNVLQKFQRKMRKAKENIWFYLSIQIIVIVEKEKYDLFLDHRQHKELFVLRCPSLHLYIIVFLFWVNQTILYYYLFTGYTHIIIIGYNYVLVVLEWYFLYFESWIFIWIL